MKQFVILPDGPNHGGDQTCGIVVIAKRQPQQPRNRSPVEREHKRHVLYVLNFFFEKVAHGLTKPRPVSRNNDTGKFVPELFPAGHEDGAKRRHFLAFRPFVRELAKHGTKPVHTDGMPPRLELAQEVPPTIELLRDTGQAFASLAPIIGHKGKQVFADKLFKHA
jgi:hypothetical protein